MVTDCLLRLQATDVCKTAIEQGMKGFPVFQQEFWHDHVLFHDSVVGHQQVGLMFGQKGLPFVLPQAHPYVAILVDAREHVAVVGCVFVGFPLQFDGGMGIHMLDVEFAVFGMRVG